MPAKVAGSTILAACCPFELWMWFVKGRSSGETQNREALTHGNPIAQRKRDTLRFAPNSNMPHDGPRLRSFDAQIGKRVLAYMRVNYPRYVANEAS